MNERINNKAGVPTNDQEQETTGAALRALVDLVQALEESQEASLNALAQYQAQRSARWRSVAERLAPYLDEQDAQLVNTRRMEKQAQDLEVAARQRLKRLETQPKPGPDDWVVTGHISYADGTPANGLAVRLFDPEHKYDHLFKGTTTSRFGDFAIVHDLCLLREKMGAAKELPDVRLLVTDKQGRPLLDTQIPVRCQDGCVEYLEILLPTQPNQLGQHKDE